MKRWAVILAGGVGSRFWPLSTPKKPKQLLALATERSLLADTLARINVSIEPERTLVLMNESLVEPTIEAVPQLRKENIVAEPKPAGTAAALAWAAREITAREGGDAVMICVHADWFIRDEDTFRATLLRAADIAEQHDSLVTVGIVPDRPDPGFGYIQPGEEVSGGSGARWVARFAEKPSREEAARMCSNGYLWNSGIFVWRASRFLEEIRTHTPEVAGAIASAPDLRTFFATVKPITVDVGVLERSKRVMVLPGDFGWDDVGTWAALARVLTSDDAGNSIRGRASVVASRNNVVFAQDSHVVLYGVDELVVVNARGITLVTTKEMAADLKSLLTALPETLTSQ